MQKRNYRLKSGFTLVELSIVLVLIGLLVGGVLVGRDLIRAAQLRSILSMKERVDTAAITFKLKYGALPGDIANATQFWPTDASCPFAAYNIVPKVETCNGNGNGEIGYFPSSTYYPTSMFYELFRFWQHLANAGLIDGQYSGTPAPAGGTGGNAEIGYNVPATSVKGVGMTLYNFTNASTMYPTSYYATGYMHAYVIGGDNAVHNGPTNWPAFTGADMKSMDTKLDDGKPATGNVSVLIDDGNWWDCTTTNVPSTAEYITTDSRIRCSGFFKAAF